MKNSPCFLPFLMSFFSSRAWSCLALDFEPTRPSSFLPATSPRILLWGSVSLTTGAFLGAAFLAPALGAAFVSASARVADLALGAAFVAALAVGAAFALLLAAVDFFTAI